MRRRRAKPSARNRLPELRQAALVNRHDARVPQPPRQLDFSAKALAGFNRKIATLMRARLHLRVGPLAVLQSIVILGGRTRSAPLPGSSNAWSPRGWMRRQWGCATNTFRKFEATGDLTPIRLVNRIQYRLSEIKHLDAEGRRRTPTRNDVNHLPHFLLTKSGRNQVSR